MVNVPKEDPCTQKLRDAHWPNLNSIRQVRRASAELTYNWLLSRSSEYKNAAPLLQQVFWKELSIKTYCSRKCNFKWHEWHCNRFCRIADDIPAHSQGDRAGVFRCLFTTASSVLHLRSPADILKWIVDMQHKYQFGRPPSHSCPLPSMLVKYSLVKYFRASIFVE